MYRKEKTKEVAQEEKNEQLRKFKIHFLSSNSVFKK